uniref:Uncharacterized protein n=1 Tax=Anguilla anguilla TaxID=7936 RepID=A0A0E9QC93_ANGAN
MPTISHRGPSAFPETLFAYLRWSSAWAQLSSDTWETR